MSYEQQLAERLRLIGFHHDWRVSEERRLDDQRIRQWKAQRVIRALEQSQREENERVGSYYRETARRRYKREIGEALKA